jgi:hypothetical protein
MNRIERIRNENDGINTCTFSFCIMHVRIRIQRPINYGSTGSGFTTLGYPCEVTAPTGSALCKLLYCSGHPCSGQLSVSDVRLRLSHTIHNTEGGKRVHSVVSNTTRVVADTGKVVAGGIGAAKVSLSFAEGYKEMSPDK